LLKDLKLDTTAIFSNDDCVYREITPKNILYTGKRNTQHIKHKHLTFHTKIKRLAHKTIHY